MYGGPFLYSKLRHVNHIYRCEERVRNEDDNVHNLHIDIGLFFIKKCHDYTTIIKTQLLNGLSF